MWKCKYCKKEYNGLNPSQKANHSRWCRFNPKVDFYRRTLKKVRKYITKEDRQRANKKIKTAWKEGRYKNITHLGMKGKHWSEESKEKLSISLRKNKYHRVCKSSFFYKGIKLDSTYELRVAQILDKNNILWTRPESMEWFDTLGKRHNYFPDFFLVKQNIYLDPKNDYCFIAQKEKIEYIKKHYKNVFFLRKEEINESMVKWISQFSPKK